MSSAAFDRPNVYGFVSYRLFIRDFFVFLKGSKNFSLRKFCMASGLKSPGYLKMIISGDRNLSEAAIDKVANGLGLKPHEGDFFRILVRFNQSQDAKTREQLFEQMTKSKRFAENFSSSISQYQFLSDWRNIAVFEAVGTSWSRLSESDRAKALDLSIKELKEVLEKLQSMGFLKREGTSWVKMQRTIVTPSETKDLQVRQYHKQMLTQALRNLDEGDRALRYLSGLTVSISPKNFEILRKKIFEFVQEMDAAFSEDFDPEHIYQINIQAFPLVKLK